MDAIPLYVVCVCVCEEGGGITAKKQTNIKTTQFHKPVSFWFGIFRVPPPSKRHSPFCFFHRLLLLTYRQWYIMWHSARCLSVIKRLLCGKRMSHSTQHGFHYPVVIQSLRIGTSGVKHLCEERGWGVYSNAQRMHHFFDDHDSPRLTWPTHLPYRVQYSFWGVLYVYMVRW